MLDGLALLHAQPLHETGQTLGAEYPQQAVFERQIEACRARIALTAGTAAQLVVDAPRLVAFGADDVQTAGADHLIVAALPVVAHLLFFRLVASGHGEFHLQVAAEHDVGAAAGHVGGNGHPARASGLGHDLRFTLVVLGVQHLVRDLFLLQEPRQRLGGFDRGRADQHRLAALVTVPDVGEDRHMFFGAAAIHLIAHVLADHRLVGRDHHHLEIIDVLELVGLGVGGTGHAGELVVEAEVVLERDRGERLVLVLDLRPLLGLDRLMQAVRPAPARHHAPGKFVDDHHLIVLDDVVHLAPEQRMRTQRRIQMMQQADVGDVVQVAVLRQQSGTHQQLLGGLVSGFGEERLTAFLVHAVVTRPVFLFLAREFGDDGVDLVIEIGVLFGGAGDDERRARLVDQDRVHLVHDRVTGSALHPVDGAKRHVVTQIIESVLVVGAVGDVGGVGGALGLAVLAGNRDADGQSEKIIDLAHPRRVTAREVVVHRNHVHTFAGQGIEVGGERRHQGLALAGAHLGDAPGVQHHAADQLHIEVAHAEGALGRLAHHGKYLRQQRIQCLTAFQTLAELDGLGAKRGVGERRHLRLQGVDARHRTLHFPDEARIAVADEFLEQVYNHLYPSHVA